MTTWKELAAQGIKRCSVHFKSGKRCRRRAVEQFEYSWCAKHGPTMKAYTDHAIAILNRQAKKDARP